MSFLTITVFKSHFFFLLALSYRILRKAVKDTLLDRYVPGERDVVKILEARLVPIRASFLLRLKHFSQFWVKLTGGDPDIEGTDGVTPRS